MRLNLAREWYERNIDPNESYEVNAGSLASLQDTTESVPEFAELPTDFVSTSELASFDDLIAMLSKLRNVNGLPLRAIASESAIEEEYVERLESGEVHNVTAALHAYERALGADIRFAIRKCRSNEPARAYPSLVSRHKWSDIDRLRRRVANSRQLMVIGE